MQEGHTPFPPESVLPDYSGGGIVNLLASIQGAYGVDISTPDTPLLAAGSLSRRQVLLVIDGLGMDCLKARASGGFLESQCLGALTSVCPSATAAAIPVYLTGLAPAQHGFPGWFTWFRELSTVAAILPYCSRAGFLSLAGSNQSPDQLCGAPPLSEKLDVPVWHISPQAIAHSCFSESFRGTAAVLAYKGFNDLIAKVLSAVSRIGDGGLVYAYWSEFDHSAHCFGIESEESRQHLLMLDQLIERLGEKLCGYDVDLIICSDHGFTDCPPGRQLTFAEHFPELAEMTQMPLTGEPRFAVAHLKQGRKSDFISCARSQLEGIANPVDSARLVESGLFGPGRPHPELQNRLGDVLLLMHEKTVLLDPMPGEPRPRMIGYHGGLSREEMLVPLIHLFC